MSADSNVVELTIKRRRHAPACSPVPKQREPRPGEDPIFAVIEHHRVLSDRARAAVEISGSMLADDPGYEAAAAITSEVEDDLIEYSELLVCSKPTTLAGILAFLRYLRTLSECETPPRPALSFDGTEPVGWLHGLFEVLENAIEGIGAKA